MREIKFRGKRLDNGEWVYGSYVAHRTNVGADELRHLIICNEEMSDQHTVDPKSVGQFAVLLDCNGKEIYEGDIVKRTFHYGNDSGESVGNAVEQISEVKWTKNYNTRSIGFHFFPCDSLGQVEVIGNIYENPI